MDQKLSKLDERLHELSSNMLNSKIMSPNKKVLIPDMKAGCSLAESITAEDVRKLKKVASFFGYFKI